MWVVVWVVWVVILVAGVMGRMEEEGEYTGARKVVEGKGKAATAEA
jgi:hypothetical protein